MEGDKIFPSKLLVNFYYAYQNNYSVRLKSITEPAKERDFDLVFEDTVRDLLKEFDKEKFDFRDHDGILEIINKF